LSIPVIKELFSGWFIDYISENSQFILVVNGFIHAGISKVLNSIDNDNMMMRKIRKKLRTI